MTFGDALEWMKAGQHVARSGWPWPEDVHAAYTGDMQPYLVVQADGRMAVPSHGCHSGVYQSAYDVEQPARL